MNAPVVMFGFNRPELQKMTMQCFANCYSSKERDILVYLDGPRNDTDRALSDLLYEMFLDYKQKEFPRMEIIRRPRNFGCRENIVQGISEAMEKYGKGIMIEDDILVSRTFLQFMDQALDFYDSNKRIWCINGFQKYIFKVPKDYKYDLYYSYLNCAWGWATWKDRWEQVDFDMTDWPQYKKSSDNMEKINRACSLLGRMLDGQYEGRLKTWDVQCMYHMVKNDFYAVECRYQQSKNIGCVPGSEHFAVADPFMLAQKFYNFMPKMVADIPIDERIMSQYRYYAYNPKIAVRIWRRLWKMYVRVFGKKCYAPIDVKKESI